MANKSRINKHKPTRKTLRPNEFYNPKTKRYEYRYKDGLGKERVISSYRVGSYRSTSKRKKIWKKLARKGG